MKFEKEFRIDHPETIGETNKEFDLANYTDWFNQKLEKLFSISVVSQQSELLKVLEYTRQIKGNPEEIQLLVDKLYINNL